MDNVQGHLRAEIHAESEASLSLEELRSTVQDSGTTNARFCGRVWRVDRSAVDAFGRFFRDVDRAGEQWRERQTSEAPTDVEEDANEESTNEESANEEGTNEEDATEEDVEALDEPAAEDAAQGG